MKNKPTLIFATGNKNKVFEVQKMIGDSYDIKSLKDLGFTGDIPETSPTFEGNALQKARFVKDYFHLDCFSEDTGLEIEVLNNEPGVFTARYGGPAKNANRNMDKVLSKLKGQKNRCAQFRTAVALILDETEYVFEGICKGQIRMEKAGTEGFGYDPIFEPEGYDITFAEMDAATKNKISHRGKAIRELIAFLERH